MTNHAAATEDDLTTIIMQEQQLQFASFSPTDAWLLGSRLRTLALAAPEPVAFGIWLGQQTLFYAGTEGIVPGLEDWLRRKRNTVLRFAQSSLRVGLELASSASTLESKHGLSTADFVSHGGGFPIRLRGTGCVGVVAVSGLPQRDDHTLIVRAISDFLSMTVPQIS